MTALALCLLVMICLLPFLGSRADVLSPPAVVSLGVAAFVLVRAAYLMSSGYPGILGFEASPLAEREAFMTRALALSALGLSCFYAGFYALSMKPVAERIPTFRPSPRKLPLTLVVATYLGIGVLSAAYLFHAIGSPAYLLTHQNLVNKLLEGYGYPYWGAQFLAISFALLIAYNGRRVTSASLVVGSTGVLVFLVLGRRWNLLIILMFILVLQHYTKKQFTRRHIALGAVVLVIVFNAIYFLRFAGMAGISRIPQYASKVSRAGVVTVIMTTSSEYKLLDAFMAVLKRYPSRFEFEHGRSLLAIPLAPIPRAIMPSKPVSYDITLAGQLVPGRVSGLPAMAFGRLHMDGGTFAIGFGMLLLGLLSRLVADYRAVNRTNSTPVILYALFLLFLLDFLRVGDYSRTLFSALRLLIPTLAGAALVCGMPTIPPRSSDPAEQAL